jgi:hypothetical protein
MSSSLENASGNGSQRTPLARDESRFRYFYPNGKPLLPEDCTGGLVVKTSYERVSELED